LCRLVMLPGKSARLSRSFFQIASLFLTGAQVSFVVLAHHPQFGSLFNQEVVHRDERFTGEEGEGGRRGLEVFYRWRGYSSFRFPSLLSCFAVIRPHPFVWAAF